MAAITGIGCWLPDEIRTNDCWPEEFTRRGAGKDKGGDRTFNDIQTSEDPAAAAIMARHLAAESKDPFLGALDRRVAPADMTSYQAEANAGLAALADAGLAPEEVDLIFSHAIIPDTIGAPAVTEIAGRIGAVNAHAAVVDTACASSVAQLEFAQAFIESGMAKTVLCTQSHLLTRAAPMTHPASPGLGDIATAYVVTKGPGIRIRSTFNLTHGEFADAVRWIRARKGDPDDTPWFVAGGDFRMGTHAMRQVKYLMRETVNFGAKTVAEAAKRAGVGIPDIGLLCSVQPRGFIPGAIAERLGLPESIAISTYTSIAHVGACGPVYNLAVAREKGKLFPGLNIAMYGQGGGFSRSAAILTVD